MWVPEKVPTTPSEVTDPAMRLISTVRTDTACGEGRAHLPDRIHLTV